jgi:hypothetical protein
MRADASTANDEVEFFVDAMMRNYGVVNVKFIHFALVPIDYFINVVFDFNNATTLKDKFLGSGKAGLLTQPASRYHAHITVKKIHVSRSLSCCLITIVFCDTANIETNMQRIGTYTMDTCRCRR